MRLARAFCFALLLCLLTACRAQPEAGPHAQAVLQQPIEPACGGDATPSAALGLSVESSFERQTRARSKIVNRGAQTRIVAPEAISVCFGPCAGYFAECEVRKSFQAPEQGPAYAVTLAPGEALELDVDAELTERSSSCEKVGVIAVMDVDGTRACAELGRFIAFRD